MTIQTLPAGPFQTNMYLLGGSDGFIVIDVPPGGAQILTDRLGEGWPGLKAVVLTHPHWDHTNDAAFVQNQGIPVYGHRESAELLENPEMLASIPGLDLNPVILHQDGLDVVDARIILKGQTFTL